LNLAAQLYVPVLTANVETNSLVNKLPSYPAVKVEYAHVLTASVEAHAQ